MFLRSAAERQEVNSRNADEFSRSTGFSDNEDDHENNENQEK